jgi:DNA repair exonuclease SbcCD ATPase subunit
VAKQKLLGEEASLISVKKERAAALAKAREEAAKVPTYVCPWPNGRHPDQEEAEQLRSEIAVAEKMAEQIQRAENAVARLTKELQEASNKLALAKSKAKAVEEAATLCSVGKIPARLISGMTEELASIISSNLAAMTGECMAISLSVDPTRTRSAVSLRVSYNGRESAYESLSTGQKKRVDLAILLAIISMRLTASNLLVLDESFDGLDDQSAVAAAEAVVEMEDKSILVMTHRPGLKEIFRTAWTVTLKGGVSTLS